MTTDAATHTADAALTFAADNADRFEQELFDLLRIPSVSTQSDHNADTRAAAAFLADDLRAIGLTNVGVHDTPGHPMVFGEWLQAGESAPTVLVYGHYDVQPPDPLDEWRTPPFEPTVADGNVYARGAADDKGQLYIHVKSVEACLTANGTLPVNVKFIFEGEEESGSPSLDAWVEANADLLRADLCLISDSHMLGETLPSLISSLRGLAYCEVTVTGPSHDLHSGTFGGAVRNPAEALAQMIAQLKGDDGHISIPGFYDDVIELTADERSDLARVPLNDETIRRETGVSEVFGEAGFTSYERTGARPTIEVNGIWGGYTGEGAKTVLPARAHAKISMRLVANQQWKRIADLLTDHLQSIAPTGVNVAVTPLHGGDPSRVDPATPALQAASRALEQVFGTTPVMTREGGSIPVVTLFERLFGMPTVLMGFGLPDDRLHSPNEKFALAQFHRGIETSIRFWYELAAL